MDENKSFSIVPQLFFDLIARVIPGSLVLGTYFFAFLDEKLNIQLVVISIFLAYLIGFILGIFSTIIWNLVFFKRIKFKKLFTGSRNVYEMKYIWSIIKSKLSQEDKILGVKVIAEFYLFRALTFIPIVFCIYKPAIFSNITAIKYLLFQALCFLTFCLCMLACYLGMCSTVDNYLDNEKIGSSISA